LFCCCCSVVVLLQNWRVWSAVTYLHVEVLEKIKLLSYLANCLMLLLRTVHIQLLLLFFVFFGSF
jgi:hypothetical protein